jgi:hypothetical protein
MAGAGPHRSGGGYLRDFSKKTTLFLVDRPFWHLYIPPQWERVG